MTITTSFFAHPDTKRIRYPMAYEGWRSTGRVEREVVIHVNGRERTVRLAFRTPKTPCWSGYPRLARWM